ncbi:MAG TPA: ABC transporter ATP-binding protein [Roseiflexaceae bacterium]|nr:ABC transporter ATP-binding protein [Roseiflexaceae bacterium]
MRHYLWELRPYFRQVAGELLLGSIAGIVMNTAVVLPAILLGHAIDTALALERGQASASAVGWAALAFVGGTLLSEGPRMLKRWWLMTANARIRTNVRADAVRGILAMPLADLHQTPIGDLMARIIGDVEVLGVGVREFIIETWDTVLFSLSLIVAMLFYDAGLTALVLLPTPLALLLSYASGRWVSARTRSAREANADLTALLQEQLAGLRVLRLFGRADAAVADIATLSQAQARANLRIVGLRSALQPVYSMLITAGVVLLIWQGGLRVVAGAMSVGAFVAYLQLYGRFIGRGFRIPQLVNSIQSGGAAYARLRPLLAPPLSVHGELARASFLPGHVAGVGQPAPTPQARGTGPISVVLRGVTFRYPGAAQPAFNDVDLDIPAGSFVAVTGPVGAGKSALSRALLGLYPLEAGGVLLDGCPLESIPPAERVARIGYLPQEPFLFSGAVYENILLTEPGARPDVARERAVDQAVALTALADDLRTFPAGLETEIGELGIRISGGQRQRIALARAIAAAAPATPGLLILDDPFSAVDVDTEAQIIAGLRAAFGPAAPPERRASIVLCSHRLAAFPQADRVVVLDGGRIVEQGTHMALLAASGLYARIYRAQQQVEQSSTPEVPV